MRNRKLFSMVLTMALTVALAVPAAAQAASVVDSTASVDYYADSEVDTEGANKCDVEATVGSSFLVVIPKKITLDKDGNCAYNVTVDANLAGTEKITVAPAAKVDAAHNGETGMWLHEAGGKADITFAVTQAKQIFFAAGSTTENLDETLRQELSSAAIENYTMVNGEAAKVDGGVAAPDITAGSWSGAFDFAIALAPKAPVEAPAEQ